MDSSESKRCVICDDILNSRQSKVCSKDCRNIYKRDSIRKKRGAHKHTYICSGCGKSISIGRRRVA